MLSISKQNKLITFVTAIHVGQYDKARRPYSEHLFRVARPFTPGSDEWVVALLHDALEDKRCELNELVELGISPDCIQALHLLNHDKAMEYYDYIKAIRMDTTLAGSIAKRVKISDILDNSDPARIFYLPEDQRYRLLMKYHQALKDLLL
jgi:hypothetical protein